MEDRQGCWDGYGQTGADYDTRGGLNMRQVRPAPASHLIWTELEAQEAVYR